MRKIYLNNQQFELLKESLKEKLASERGEVNTNPTEKQAKAGNYKMGHISVHGFEIAIENPKGSYRKGKDRDGKEWKTYMHNDYGYFTRTVGKDGDAIDVFLGNNLDSQKIFAVDQFLKGEFDETKIMMGFNEKEQAKNAYLSNYEKDWKGFKYITEVDIDTFKKWLYDGYRQRKPFAKYVRLTESTMINEAQGLKSKKLYDIFKQYGRPSYGKHFDSSEGMDLHNVTDNDVVGVFKSSEIPNTDGKILKWISSKGYDIDNLDGFRKIELAKHSSEGEILYAIVINRNANFDTYSNSKDGGFKDYCKKQDDREANAQCDGSKTYQWKDGNEAEHLMLHNPYYQGWGNDAKQRMQQHLQGTYGEIYDKVKGISEMKKHNPPKDEVAAINKANRDEDIKNHGKSIAFRTTMTKNPKAYSRKGKKVELTEEQFKGYCRFMLREKRKEDYIKSLLQEVKFFDYERGEDFTPDDERAYFTCELPNQSITGYYTYTKEPIDYSNCYNINVTGVHFDNPIEDKQFEQSIEERVRTEAENSGGGDISFDYMGFVQLN